MEFKAAKAALRDPGPEGEELKLGTGFSLKAFAYRAIQ